MCNISKTSIDEWLNLDTYNNLLPQNIDYSVYPPIVSNLRSIEDWRRFSEQTRPGNQALHKRSPEIFSSLKRLRTAWSQSDADLYPDVNLQLTDRGDLIGLSVTSQGLSSQDRAVLEVLEMHTAYHKKDLTKILIAEPLSPLSLQIRGRFPLAIASAFTPFNRDRFFPINHIDLQDINMPDSSLDVIISIEVLEHLTDYKSSLREAYRVLDRGGSYIFTCPFYWNRMENTIKSILRIDGTVEHLLEPEYHGDPLRPDDGILVYQIPGWELIGDIVAAGFNDATACYIHNVNGGIIGRHISGCFVFVCQK